MHYKDEKQTRNAIKLQRKFDKDNVPNFIRDYFYNLNSEAGKLNYYSIIISTLKWMIDNGRIDKLAISEIKENDLNAISKTDVIVYLEKLFSDGACPSTINTKKNVLSSFWTHMVDEGICEKNIIKSIPKSKFKIKKKNNAKVPLPEDIIDMIANIEKKKDDFIRERNLIVLRVLKGTGLRESELAGLDINDLHLDCENPYITVMGKGVYYAQDAENVWVSKDARLAFSEWLKIRSSINNIVDKNALFINKNGKRLTEDNIIAIFKNYSHGKITPHMIRHLHATVLYQESGHDAAFVAEQLRHADVNTTLSIYASGNTERNHNVLNNI